MLQSFRDRLFGRKPSSPVSSEILPVDATALPVHAVTPAAENMRYVFFDMVGTAKGNPGLVQGIHAVKEQLAQTGLQILLVACSHSHPDDVATELKEMDVEPLVDAIYSGCQADHRDGKGHSSLQKDYYRFWEDVYLADGDDRFTHVPPTQIFLIDDFEDNVEAIIRAGGSGYVFMSTQDPECLPGETPAAPYNRAACAVLAAHYGI